MTGDAPLTRACACRSKAIACLIFLIVVSSSKQIKLFRPFTGAVTSLHPLSGPGNKAAAFSAVETAVSSIMPKADEAFMPANRPEASTESG